MTTAPTLPRRLSEDERRIVLVEAAERIFLAQGYAAASMDDVAQAAGMSKKTLYHLYASKEALFDAVVERFCAPMHDAAVPNAPDRRAALVRVLEDIADHILSPRSVALFRVIASEVKRAPELAAAIERIRGRKANVLQAWLAAQAAAGWLDIDDAEETAGMLIGMVVGEPHMLMLLGMRQAPTAEERAARVRLAVSIFLGRHSRDGLVAGVPAP